MLDDLLERYLNQIKLLIRGRQSDKVLFELRNEVYSLFQAMDMSGIQFTVPDRVMAAMHRGDDSQIDRAIRELFVVNFYKTLDLNKKVTSIVDDAHMTVGDGYFLDHKKPMPIEEIGDLVDSFFGEYDEDMQKFFEERLKDEKIYFIKNNDEYYEGMTFFIDSQNDTFLLAEYDGTINSAVILAHELAHAYSKKYINNTFEQKIFAYINDLDEVYSKYMEYVFIDYLKKIHFNKKEIKTLEVNSDMNLIGFLDDYKEFIDQYESNPKDIYNDDSLLFPFIDSEQYSYGQIVGYNFFNNYLKDKDKTKSDILDFVSDTGKYDKTYMLNHYGLNEKEVTSSKKLVKDMKKHFYK
ncbi:MAG: hypothetical protein IJI43_02620 [Bacilli bacterium]|nr:hypothetical protein [Bacilli bacterium]